jgi:hypothetical protein
VEKEKRKKKKKSSRRSSRRRIRRGRRKRKKKKKDGSCAVASITARGVTHLEVPVMSRVSAGSSGPQA